MHRTAALFLLPFLMLTLLVGNWIRYGKTHFLPWIVAGLVVIPILFVYSLWMIRLENKFLGFTRIQLLALTILSLVAGLVAGFLVPMLIYPK
jgi:hypothetical protein